MYHPHWRCIRKIQRYLHTGTCKHMQEHLGTDLSSVTTQKTGGIKPEPGSEGTQLSATLQKKPAARHARPLLKKHKTKHLFKRKDASSQKSTGYKLCWILPAEPSRSTMAWKPSSRVAKIFHRIEMLQHLEEQWFSHSSVKILMVSQAHTLQLAFFFFFFSLMTNIQ